MEVPDNGDDTYIQLNFTTPSSYKSQVVSRSGDNFSCESENVVKALVCDCARLLVFMRMSKRLR